MKFNVIIGNPPYQEMTGGGQTGAKPIYHYFVEKAILMSEYTTMITPSRWLIGGAGLDKFRESILTSKHLSHLYDYEKSTDIFPTVEIAGGICYYLIDTNNIYDKCEIHNCHMVNNKVIDNIRKRTLQTYIDKESYETIFIGRTKH